MKVITRWRAALAAGLAGAVLAAGGVAVYTSAALADQARLNLGDAVGFANHFDIAVVLPSGTVEQADREGGYSWKVKGAELLVPGRSLTTTIPVFNNTPNLAADVTMEVELLNGDGSVGAAPNITKFLRFTATRADGKTLFKDAKWSHTSANLGVLAARGSNALDQGDSYAAGADGSEQKVTLVISYPDADGTEDYNGGLSAFAVRFHATSTRG